MSFNSNSLVKKAFSLQVHIDAKSQWAPFHCHLTVLALPEPLVLLVTNDELQVLDVFGYFSITVVFCVVFIKYNIERSSISDADVIAS